MGVNSCGCLGGFFLSCFRPPNNPDNEDVRRRPTVDEQPQHGQNVVLVENQLDTSRLDPEAMLNQLEIIDNSMELKASSSLSSASS